MRIVRNTKTQVQCLQNVEVYILKLAVQTYNNHYISKSWYDNSDYTDRPTDVHRFIQYLTAKDHLTHTGTSRNSGVTISSSIVIKKKNLLQTISMIEDPEIIKEPKAKSSAVLQVWRRRFRRVYCSKKPTWFLNSNYKTVSCLAVKVGSYAKWWWTYEPHSNFQVLSIMIPIVNVTAGFLDVGDVLAYCSTQNVIRYFVSTHTCFIKVSQPTLRGYMNFLPSTILKQLKLFHKTLHAHYATRNY